MTAAPDVVVGSGPSGVATAEALLAAGRKVVMVDAGGRLERDRAIQKDRLASLDPAEWTDGDLGFLRDHPTQPGELSDKQSFGSDYPYARPALATALLADGTGLKPSYAVGGLSTVWGGALLPFRDSDLVGWPIGEADLAEGYSASTRLMPLSARRDALDRMLPLHGVPRAALRPSRQAEAVLETLTAERERLSSEGVTFGNARLAVDAEGCVSCGLCLRGCPHDLIYSASQTLARQKAAGLVHESGVLVRSLEETADGVVVHAVRRDGSAFTQVAGRVFLAAGVVNSTEVLLRTMNWVDRPVTIKDAQYFLIPALRWRGTAHVARERLHTLSQIFIELDDAALSRFTIHLQLYTYSDMIREVVHAKIGRLAPFLPLNPLLGRLMVLQSFLHSDHSGRIEVRLARSHTGEERLVLTGQPNAAAQPIVRGVAKKLGRLARLTGFSPVVPMIEITEPGRGFHAGGSFPMAKVPTSGQTDMLGRPAGFSRIHLVDSSTFPSIPATTITLPVMANAYRIGAAVSRLLP